MFDFWMDLVTLLLPLSIFGGWLWAQLRTREGKLQSWLLPATLLLSLVSGLTVTLIKLIEAKRTLNFFLRFNRQLSVLALAFVLLAFLLWLLATVSKKKALMTLGDVSASLSIWALLTINLPFAFLKLGELVAFGEDSFGSQSILRLLGYLLAVLFLYLLAMSVQALLRRSGGEGRLFFDVLLMVAILVDLGVRGVSALARLKLLSSRSDWVFSVMRFEDQGQSFQWLLYCLLLSFLAFFVLLRHLRLKQVYEKAAQRRKALWFLRKARRFAFLLLSLLVLYSVALLVLQPYLNRPVELTPPKPYYDEGSLIRIPLNEVDDGHLHRFSFVHEGHDIRFIVVKKPNGSAYGLGLDACDICGVAGYYERDNEVVCKRCDVVMNKATIGFKGGCNPVPFEYEIRDGQIYVKKETLAQEKDRFPKE